MLYTTRTLLHVSAIKHHNQGSVSTNEYITLIHQIYIYMAQQPLVGHGLLSIEASRSHSDTPHSVGLLWGMINPSQRSLHHNTQQSQGTDIHAPGRIRTHNPSKRSAADQRLRPRGHWDRQKTSIQMNIYY